MENGHITCPNFANPHGFLSRNGGMSTGVYESLNCGPGSNDDPDSVLENRRIAAGIIAGRRSEPVVSCYQVHGNTVVYVTEDWGPDRPKADAMVTDHPGLILGVLTADCVPVLFEDAEARVVGAAHAGWQGALAGVTDSTLVAMEKLGANRNRITAAIGPAIGQQSYEVGTDFRNRFIEAPEDSAVFFKAGKDGAHFQFDLKAYVESRLKAAGIATIWVSDVDTYTSEDHFSYRRTTHRGETDYGRQLSAIMLAPETP